MQAKLLENVTYEGQRYRVGEIYDMPPEIYNAIYPSARYIDDDMCILSEPIRLDVAFNNYATYPLDGYGRLNRFFMHNFIFNERSNIRFFCSTPVAMDLIKKDRRKIVLYTMFEGDKLPQDWVNRLNDKPDVIVVPSNFCKKTFQDSGVKKPILVLPLFFIPARRHVELKDDDVFTFGHQNSFIMGHQKGDDVLMKAFIKAFGDDTSVKLILKGRKHHYQALDHDMLKKARKHKNIKVLLSDFSDDEIYTKFYSQLDCFVFPSRGEGFGMPPLEAMSIGVPTIVTAGHSLSDYANLAIPVKTKGKSVSYYVGRVLDSVDSNWEQIDEKHLIELLLEVRKNYNDYKFTAYKNARVVNDLYRPETFAKNLVHLLNRL